MPAMWAKVEAKETKPTGALTRDGKVFVFGAGRQISGRRINEST